MSSDDLLMSSDCLLMSSIGAEMAQVLRAYDDQTRDGKLQLSEFSVLIRDLDRGIIREQALSDEVIRRHSSLDLDRGIIREQALSDEVIRRHSSLDPQQHPQGSDARLPSTLDQSSILRWSAQRREEEAAQLRTLERSLRDEALAEQLLSEQASLMASDCLPPHMMLLSEQGEFATEAH